ncbi:MAG: hypothetical protein IPN08_04065 [Bacteroidales bacterium]|nr:hypothetical protein [Bacteroidales bacterium]
MTADHTVTITPSVESPVFALGATSTRCQGAGSVTYTATATNTTGITYTLDAASIAGGVTINAATGEVTYPAGWFGTTVITASAAGCNGPLQSIHIVTVSPTHILTLTSTPGTNNQTVCINTPITAITYAVSGVATGVSNVSGLPANVTWAFNAGVLTISGTPNVGGSFTYSISTSGNSCNPGPVAGTITVTDPGTANITGTNTICVGSTPPSPALRPAESGQVQMPGLRPSTGTGLLPVWPLVFQILPIPSLRDPVHQLLLTGFILE